MNIGVAGLIHGHVWGLIESAKRVAGIELTAVADPTPLLERAKPDFARQYIGWRDMLATESLDGLIVTSDNVESAQIAVEALAKGIPCLVEKAMAANAADADRMRAAAIESGKILMINWPFAWNPTLHDIRKRIHAGEIGHVFHMKYRNGHQGPEEIGCDEYFVGWLYDEARNGGGAIADFGGYGCVLAAWYFGLPETVYAVRGNLTKDYPVCDDHALIVLKYPGRDVVLEATWATCGFDEAANPALYGNRGTLGAYGDKLLHYSVGEPGVELSVTPLALGNPLAYFKECIEQGRNPEGMLNPDVAANACRILDAALKSCASGCAVKPVPAT